MILACFSFPCQVPSVMNLRHIYEALKVAANPSRKYLRSIYKSFALKLVTKLLEDGISSIQNSDGNTIGRPTLSWIHLQQANVKLSIPPAS